MGAGITLLREWANTGTKIKPSDAQIDLGWVGGEQPPYEWENERMNTRDVRINQILTYLNAGVPLDDLIDGDAALTNSSIELNDGGTDVVTLDQDEVRVANGSDYMSMTGNGWTVNDQSMGSFASGVRPLKFALAPLTFSPITSDGVTNGYQAFVNQDLDETFLAPAAAPFYGAFVCNDSGSTLVYQCLQVKITNNGGNMRINTIIIPNIGDFNPGGSATNQHHLYLWSSAQRI